MLSYFLFPAKDRQEKPFAMSFVKLMQDNGVTISDTDHDLLVYKVRMLGPPAESPTTHKQSGYICSILLCLGMHHILY